MAGRLWLASAFGIWSPAVGRGGHKCAGSARRQVRENQIKSKGREGNQDCTMDLLRQSLLDKGRWERIERMGKGERNRGQGEEIGRVEDGMYYYLRY